MSDVLEINDIDALEDYRLVWRSLLAASGQASVFQTLDWLKCYWRHFGEGQRLRVLIVTAGGKPLGIVPLTVIRERTRVGVIRVLTYPLHDWGWFYGPIGPHPAATLTAAMGYLAAARRDWDLLDLRWTDDDRVDHGRTQRAMQAAGFPATKAIWKTTAVVATTGAWENYLAGKTAKQRNNLRRHEKRVAALGEVELERHRPCGAAHGDDDPRWDLYDAAVEVAGKSWQAGATDGTTISDPPVRDFFRETYAVAVDNGMADLCLLKAGGRPIAFAYNYAHDGYCLGIRFGFDQEFSKAGAGNVMYTRVLENSFRRGDRVFDLGIGSLDIKRGWLTELVHSYRLTHYPLASPRSQILRLKHWWDRRKPADGQLAP